MLRLESSFADLAIDEVFVVGVTIAAVEADCVNISGKCVGWVPALDLSDEGAFADSQEASDLE